MPPSDRTSSAAKKLLSEELIEERREEQRRENEQDAATPYDGGHDADQAGEAVQGSSGDRGGASGLSAGDRGEGETLRSLDVPDVAAGDRQGDSGTPPDAPAQASAAQTRIVSVRPDGQDE